MKYFLRLFWLVISQSRRPRCALLGTCTTPFRVWPNDLDVFLHMNNGAFLTIADLGRIDLLLRADVFHEMRSRAWYPIVAGETIRFRRSLRLFQRYTIHTRLLGWTQRSFYVEQIFLREGELIARALIDVRIMSRRGGAVPIEEVLEAADGPSESPALPAWVDDWAASMRHMEAGAARS